jgi:putative transposase
LTDDYDYYQNAVAERVNGILKGEFLLHKPTNLAEARKLIAQSIQPYKTGSSGMFATLFSYQLILGLGS